MMLNIHDFAKLNGFSERSLKLLCIRRQISPAPEKISKKPSDYIFDTENKTYKLLNGNKINILKDYAFAEEIARDNKISRLYLFKQIANGEIPNIPIMNGRYHLIKRQDFPEKTQLLDSQQFCEFYNLDLPTVLSIIKQNRISPPPRNNDKKAPRVANDKYFFDKKITYRFDNIPMNEIAGFVSLDRFCKEKNLKKAHARILIKQNKVEAIIRRNFILVRLAVTGIPKNDNKTEEQILPEIVVNGIVLSLIKKRSISGNYVLHCFNIAKNISLFFAKDSEGMVSYHVANQQNVANTTKLFANKIKHILKERTIW